MTSRIEFLSIEMKNFLSIGNYPIKLNLSDFKTTLIHGVNGAGKSTFFEGINYALYDNLLRADSNTPIESVINMDLKKNCHVTLTLKINGELYVLERGRKNAKTPFMKIHKNGEEIKNAFGNYNAYQKHFLTKILKLNQITFLQQVLFGTGNYIPYLMLKEGDRKPFIDNVLNLKVFEKADEIHKEKRKQTKKKLAKVNTEITKLETFIAAKEESNQELENLREEQDKENRKKLASIKKEINTFVEENNRYQKDIDAFDQEVYDNIMDECAGFHNSVQTLIHEIESIKHKHQHIDTTHVCDQCERDIPEELRNARKEKLNISFIQKKEELVKKQKEQEEIKVKKLEQKELKAKAQKAENVIINNNNLIRKYEKDIKELVASLTAPKKGMTDLTQYRKDLKKEYEQKSILEHEKEKEDVIYEALSKNTIKNQVIQKYIPIVNALANQNLDILGFPGEIKFDKDFNVTVHKYYNPDEMQYKLLSQGERQRIDVSIIFTWAQVCMEITGISTNLMLFDEVLDSSLDSDGTEKLFDLLREHNKNRNFVIISHKSDLIEENFSRVIEVRKDGKYSKMVEHTQ
jgi:DNA repair exonuclease SbcCD ATPase subunit